MITLAIIVIVGLLAYINRAQAPVVWAWLKAKVASLFAKKAAPAPVVAPAAAPAPAPTDTAPKA